MSLIRLGRLFRRARLAHPHELEAAAVRLERVPPASGEQEEIPLIAYAVGGRPRLRLVPAPAQRSWMTETNQHFANRCLPLLLANQAGWLILNSHPVRVLWSGGDSIGSLQVEHLEGSSPYTAVSHFGHGILTWTLPYLFVTPLGYNLLVRGPSNWPKDGITPLEGLVETDWSAATFTMNWKVTRAGHPITFDADEPICMLVPQRRGELESVRPRIRHPEADRDVHDRFTEWRKSRSRFLADLKLADSPAVREGWQKDYFRGQFPNGATAPQHQLKLRLRGFDEDE